MLKNGSRRHIGILTGLMLALIVAVPVMADESVASLSDIDSFETEGLEAEVADDVAKSNETLGEIPEWKDGSDNLTTAEEETDDFLESWEEQDVISEMESGDESVDEEYDVKDSGIIEYDESIDLISEIDVYDESNTTDLTDYNGFFQDPESGDWYYYIDGQIATDINSVIEGTVNGENAWWYVVGGKVQINFTGLANYSNSSGWWYIEKGKVTFSYNGVEKNKNGWYYVKDSKVDFSYNGFAKNSNGWWYIENGKVTFNKNSVIKDNYKMINGLADWWYVVESKVQTSFTGLADYKNENGWWYIKDGKVDFTKNTVAKNKNGWWYVLDGKVQFGFTGLANYSNENGWWYIKDGKVDFTKNTVAKNKNGWWYVLDGKVQFGFTGLADYSNSNGWWYIENGKVTFTKETVAKNKNGWYYVKDSKVDFNYNGIAQNSNGWWYIKNGKVDFSAGDYSFAANTSQVIDVRASGSRGTLTLYDKSGGSFTQKLSTSCYLGRNGITSNKSEGDGKTPSGVYTLGQAFGVASDPGSTRSYLKLNSNYYWVDDSTSKYYNQLVDISKVTKDWSSAEHLIDNTNSYKYAIAINYNTACTPYKGSAIFLHCSVGSTTSGCVAVSESNMIKILQLLKSDTRIYIH